MRSAIIALAVAQSAAALPQWGPPPSWNQIFNVSSWGFGAGGPPFGTPGVPFTPLPNIQHVAVFSVDGMHSSDVTKYLAARPNSTMASLLSTGYQYPNAYTSAPSDSFPGTVAQFTGATPSYSGVWYDDTWDFTYYPPGTNCTGPVGANALFDETIDYNDTLLFSGGINPANLPMAVVNGKCTPIYPHARLRTNTVFEVVHSKGFQTAYVDKHPAYDLVRGPSGTGLSTGYFPEMAASSVNSTVAGTIAYDQLHAQAFLDYLDAIVPANSEGNLSAVPSVMGGNFQALNVAQKNLTGGYLNTTGNPPSALVLQALDSVDSFLTQFVVKLKSRNLYENTLIIVAAKHGQAPINPVLFGEVDPAALQSQIGVPTAWVTTDDVALIWLNSTSDINAATTNLARNASALKILNIFAGANQTALGFGSPLTDERVPDIIVQPELGIIYTTSKKKMAEHGGFSSDDRNVACFASHPAFKKTVFNQTVQTTQVAPTILEALGISPNNLQAVVAEGTPVLPGF